MANSSLSTLENYLQQYGWAYEKNDSTSMVAKFVGESSDTEFNVLFRVSEHWLSITVLPFLPKPPDEHEQEVTKKICVLNYDLKLAKLAMSNEGYIILSIELPLSNINSELFSASLDILTYYADELFPELIFYWSNDRKP